MVFCAMIYHKKVNQVQGFSQEGILASSGDPINVWKNLFKIHLILQNVFKKCAHWTANFHF